MLRLLCCLLAAVSLLASLHAADAPRALPLNTPSVLNVITFAYFSDSENRKVIVTTSPALQRIDEPDDRWSFIYDPTSQFYTGLEHERCDAGRSVQRRT